MRTLGSRECERSGAELRGEHPTEMPRGVAGARGQTGYALALDDSVGDHPHGAPGHVGVNVPLG